METKLYARNIRDDCVRISSPSAINLSLDIAHMDHECLSGQCSVIGLVVDAVWMFPQTFDPAGSNGREWTRYAAGKHLLCVAYQRVHLALPEMYRLQYRCAHRGALSYHV
jgi:hypothetical protein